MVRRARITTVKRPLDGSVAVVDEHAEADLVAHFEQYARERPAMVALWCFGVGFVLGWRLKPW
jgi:hypothetical protein